MLKKIMLMMLLMSTIAYASDEVGSELQPTLDVSKMTRPELLAKVFAKEPLTREEKDRCYFSYALEKAFGLDQPVNHIFMSESSNLFPFLKYLALEWIEPDIDPRFNTEQRFDSIRQRLFKETGYLTFRKIYYFPEKVTASDLTILSSKLEKIDLADDFSFLLCKYLNVVLGITPGCQGVHIDPLLSLPQEVKVRIGSYLNAKDMASLVQAAQCCWFIKSELEWQPIIRAEITKFLNHFKKTVHVNYKQRNTFPGMLRCIITDLDYEYLLVNKGKGHLVDYLPNANVQGVNEQLFPFWGNAAHPLNDPLYGLFASVLTTAIYQNRIDCAVSDDPDDQEDDGCVLM